MTITKETDGLGGIMIRLKQFPKYPESFLRRKSAEITTVAEADEIKQKLNE